MMYVHCVHIWRTSAKVFEKSRRGEERVVAIGSMEGIEIVVV